MCSYKNSKNYTPTLQARKTRSATSLPTSLADNTPATMSNRKVLLPPINFIFKLLQQGSTVQIWLYEQLGIRIEGKIRGFDEFMNLVRLREYL